MKLASFTLFAAALRLQAALMSNAVVAEVGEEIEVEVELSVFDAAVEDATSPSCVFRIEEQIRNLRAKGEHMSAAALHPSTPLHERQHRRMVSIDLPDQPDGCDVVSLVIPHEGMQRSFHKNHSKPGRRLGEEESAGASKFAYWSGMDEADGSLFDFVQDDEGHLAGSVVDVTNDNVFQFHSNYKGEYAVTITPSSEFAEEIDPISDNEVEGDNAGRMLRASGSTSRGRGNYEEWNDTSSISSSGAGPAQMLNSLKNNLTEQASRKLGDDLGGNLDVMVVWSKRAECDYNGLSLNCTPDSTTQAAMIGLIELAIQETNTGYQNSGVQTELLLVHKYRHPTFVEGGGYSAMLNAVTNGDVPGVHDARTEYGADIVVLMIDDPQYCGIAWLGPSITRMFSVTAWNCATGYYTFGHEIGHNYGNNHDRGASNACSNSNYQYGWRDPQARFRSVLAYNCASGQCDGNAGGGCTRVNYYSNPNFLYNGNPIGNAANDNARRINDVREAVAAYYPHKGGVTLPPSPVTPAPTKAPVPVTPAPTKTPIAIPSLRPSLSSCGDGVCQVDEGEGCGYCSADCTLPTNCNIVTNSGSGVYSSSSYGLVFDAVVGPKDLYFYGFKVYLYNKDATVKIYMKDGSFTSDSNLNNWSVVFDGDVMDVGSRQEILFQSRFYATAGSTVAFYISYTEGANFVYSRDTFSNDDVSITRGNALREQTGNTLPGTAFSGRYLLDGVRYDFASTGPITPAPVPSTSVPSSSPSKPPSKSPITLAPVVSPTLAPVPSSTLAPVPSPTSTCSCCEEMRTKMEHMESLLERIVSILESSTPTPVGSPTASPVACTDRTGKWSIGGTSKKWCSWAAESNTETRCSKKDLFEDCPKTCNRCP